MPTITFSLKDLENLVGKKIKIEELAELLHYAKGDFESYDKETDEVKADFGDTNLPYLWSVEGIAILLKGILKIEKGTPKIKIKESDETINVDSNIKQIRPYIAGFSAKGKKVDDYLIKQIIQLQEKLCENYGGKRERIAIGVYSHKKIKFPITYKAIDPEGIEFIPLEFKKKMTPQEILEEHPTGKSYARLMENFKKYPILIDADDNVLSFPPIINSNDLGKIEEGDEDLFVEVTGTDFDSVNLATNIFASAFYERGFSIYSLKINYPDKKLSSPYFFNEKVKITKKQIKDLLGIEIDEKETKKLAEMARYDFNNYLVDVPFYRADILHPVDIIEDIGIIYGFDKVEINEMKTYTHGETSGLSHFVEKIREILIGFGYIEVLTQMLTNKEILYEKTCSKNFGTVELENYTSERHNVIRTWLLPMTLEFLSKNTNKEYPQNIFEQGLVCVKSGEEVEDVEKLAVVSAHKDSNFTQMKQIFESIADSLGVKFEVEELKHDSLIEGRAAKILFNNKEITFIGEIHPQVLENFGIKVPVCGMEIDLSKFLKLIKK